MNIHCIIFSNILVYILGEEYEKDFYYGNIFVIDDNGNVAEYSCRRIRRDRRN